MRLLFFGTPDFAASILEHIVETTHHEVLAVISKPDALKGRGQQLVCTPVKQMAQRVLPTVPVFQPIKASTPEGVAYLDQFHSDMAVVVAYGELLKPALFDLPKFGSYNIHASLLPAYRGAAPIQRALMDGCSKSGITIFQLSTTMDSGDIVWQEGCSIDSNMTAGELTENLLVIAKRGIVEVLARIEAGSMVMQRQSHEGATPAPKLQSKDLILTASSDIWHLHNRIRALSPHPGAYFVVLHRNQRKRLKVLRSRIDVSQSETCVCWRKTSQGFLGLATPKGTLVLETVQFEGRSAMSSEMFLRGLPLSEFLFE